MNCQSQASLPQILNRALTAFRSAAERTFGKRLREVVLFGSYARGDARPDSDVDVLLVVEDATWRDRHLAAGLTVEPLLEHMFDFAPLVMSPEELNELRRRDRLLAREIDGQGVVI